MHHPPVFEAFPTKFPTTVTKKQCCRRKLSNSKQNKGPLSCLKRNKTEKENKQKEHRRIKTKREKDGKNQTNKPNKKERIGTSRDKR